MKGCDPLVASSQALRVPGLVEPGCGFGNTRSSLPTATLGTGSIFTLLGILQASRVPFRWSPHCAACTGGLQASGSLWGRRTAWRCGAGLALGPTLDGAWGPPFLSWAAVGRTLCRGHGRSLTSVQGGARHSRTWLRWGSAAPVRRELPPAVNKRTSAARSPHSAFL